MARDWSREPYRKLLRNPSSSFRSLSVLAQALFYVLVREADDDGRLAFDRDWSKGVTRVFRLLGVAPTDRKMVMRRLEELVADGCVRHVDGHLLIPNLVAINVRRDGRGKVSGDVPAEAPAGLRDDSLELRDDSVRAPAGLGQAPGRLSQGSGEAAARLSFDPAGLGSDASSENHSAETASRARQVGREVGREGGSDGGCAESPPTPPPSGPARWSDRATLVGRTIRAHTDLFASLTKQEIAPYVERIEKELAKVASVNPGDIWPDLESEVDSWVSHARKKNEGRGRTPTQVLGDVEDLARTRCRERNSKAREERDRGRRVGAASGDSPVTSDAWELLDRKASNV